MLDLLTEKRNMGIFCSLHPLLFIRMLDTCVRRVMKSEAYFGHILTDWNGKMKVIGTKKERTPEECLIAQEKLIAELNELRPFKKPKGIVLKFKTWEDLENFSRTRAADLYE